MIRNMTPHPVAIYVNGMKEDPLVIPPDPEGPIRLACDVESVGMQDGVRLVSFTYGEPFGVPPEEPGTLLIVSLLVMKALRREDMVVPSSLIRGPSGEVTGCLALGREA
jgi:hypothetical protein